MKDYDSFIWLPLMRFCLAFDQCSRRDLKPELAIFLALDPQSPKPGSQIEEAWNLLEQGIHNKIADQRSKAVDALSLLLHNPKAEAWAEAALSDPQTEVRVSAANTLAKMANPEARPKLRQVLRDPEAQVVIAAANALYVLKDPMASDSCLLEGWVTRLGKRSLQTILPLSGRSRQKDLASIQMTKLWERFTRLAATRNGKYAPRPFLPSGITKSGHKKILWHLFLMTKMILFATPLPSHSSTRNRIAAS